MANTKVSAFTAASALGGTEVVGGVQGGANAKITIDQIKTYCRTYHDATAIGNVASNSVYGGTSNRMVRTAAGVYYYFFGHGSDSDLYYTVSTDYGTTWSTPYLIKVTITCIQVAVWFDKWTPGDSGAIIHLTYTDSVTGDVFYRAIDTAQAFGAAQVGSEITVLNGTSGVAQAGTLSVTKSKAGRILCVYDIDGGTEHGFAKSDDYPVTAFTAKTSPTEAADDFCILLPGNYADTNDISCLFWDASANEISIKGYDDSANNWTGIYAETSIAGTMTDPAKNVSPNCYAATVNRNNGHIYLVAWSTVDTLNATLRFWDIDNDDTISVGAPVTIATSTDDQGHCAITIDESNYTDLVVYYGGKTDGSETWTTALNVYYKTSTNNGAAWGSETALTSAARAITALNASLTTTGGEKAVMWGGAEVAGAHTMRCSSWT